MAKKKLYPSKKLTAEQESLLRQEVELRRREALLKRRLQELPGVMERKRRHQSHPLKTMHTSFSNAARMPTAMSQRGRHRQARPSSREKNVAKIKFIILVLILSSLLILIWRSLPV